MFEDAVKQDENLRLAGLWFKAAHGDAAATTELKSALITRMALPFYQEVEMQLDWPKDAELATRLQAEISKRLGELTAKLDDARANAGESEVREALLARAKFYASIFDIDMAETAYAETMTATVGVGQKIDIVFSLIRLALVRTNFKAIASNIAKAKTLIETGGDWERRNRLKVYEATYLIARRDIKGAAKLLLESLQTFSATELYEYKTFVLYTVITALVSVDRPTLRDKVANAPEILTVILETPLLSSFLTSLVECDYKTYTRCLPEILDVIGADRYLSVHKNFIGRELRVVSYAQFLASYQSVTIAAMCKNFGVGQEFMDRELSRFIAAGRLNCKIDMVGGVIETTRPDAKNALYHRTIKQGDVLLNRVQKLSRVIDI